MNGFYHFTVADHDEHNEKKEHKKSSDKHDEHGNKHHFNVVNIPKYKEHCGACHFPYQAELLPSGSWEKILSGTDNHFGEKIEIDPDSKNIISKYLKNSAADYSSIKLSSKIMKSLGNQTPMRITDIPYIKKKHNDISPNILNNKSISIGSLSNCSACHKTADQGIYKDDNVTIPK